MSWEVVDALNSGLEAPPQGHKMLRRRVLTIDEFAREKSLSRMQSKAKYGTTYVPIPVPLALGETEQQYEDAFRAYTEKVSHRGFHEVVAEWDAPKERQRRCTFAMHRLNEFKAKHVARRRNTTSDTTERSVDDFEMPPRPGQKRETREKPEKREKREKPQRAERSPEEVEAKERRRRMELYATRYVDLEAHRQAMREGYLTKVKEMTSEEKVREFGSAIVPIFVPLARGETQEQYEERFIKWIFDKHGLTLDELENHPKETEERHYRMMFSQANTFGKAKFVPPRKRASDRGDEDKRDETPRKKLKEDASTDREKTSMEAAKPKAEPSQKTSCTGQDTVASLIACGCRRCLVKGMRSLAKKITDAEATKREREIASARVTHVVDLTSDTESMTSGFGSPGRSVPLKPASVDVEDPIEMKLAAAYDSTNEQIVMNENVLEGSATRLLNTPVADIQETTRVQDEDQEMRELIQDEMKSRSEALAVLIVYLWRNEIGELKTMVDDPNATNVVYVQRASHHKCAQLAIDITTKREILAQLKSQLDSAAAEPSSDQNARLLTHSMLTALKSDIIAELKPLFQRRRRELVQLIYFDQRIRQLVEALLKRV